MSCIKEKVLERLSIQTIERANNDRAYLIQQQQTALRHVLTFFFMRIQKNYDYGA